ncbi:MAG: hypothetical protein RBR42_12620 [Desulfomicrobium sp.]|nr:hypothetical protein [Desulfomicrobium sp.]
MFLFIFQKMIRYLCVAPWPHLTTVKVSALALVSGWKGRIAVMGPEIPWTSWLWFVGAGLFLWGMILCQADALSRYREFQRIRRIFHRYGFRPHVLGLVSQSRCQRDAAVMAAQTAGYGPKAKDFYRALGYRWYHILPDTIMANPLSFFCPRFLRSTFIPGKTCVERKSNTILTG